MKIRFLGPLDLVTGSAYWLRDDDLNVQFLIDCGMQQGEFTAERWNRQDWPFDPSRLDFVVATHAHLDHVGLIPRLYRNGFKGRVYATKETAAIATLTLKDAVRHGADYEAADVDRIKWVEPPGLKFGHHFPVFRDVFAQFFRAAHIPGAVSVRVSWGPPPLPAPDGERAPSTQKSIMFSGDIGNNVEGMEQQALLRHRHGIQPSDYAVMESTYGSQTREAPSETFEGRIAALKQHLDDALKRGGPVIVPCFAVGRTQDVLFDLHYLFAREPLRYENVDLRLDAPLAEKMNIEFATALARTRQTNKGFPAVWTNKRLFEWMDLDEGDGPLLIDMLKFMLGVFEPNLEIAARRAEHRSPIVRNWTRRTKKVLNTKEKKSKAKRSAFIDAVRKAEHPTVIVTGGGMCEGGPVVSYLQSFLRSTRATVLLTGYAGPTTTGGRLLAISDVPPEDRVNLQETVFHDDADPVPVRDIRATIGRLSGYSGHADQRGLVNWAVFKNREGVECCAASERLFLTHGNRRARESLEAALRNRFGQLVGSGPTIECPSDVDMWFDLDSNTWCELSGGEADAVGMERQVERLWLEVRELRAEVDRLRDMISGQGVGSCHGCEALEETGNMQSHLHSAGVLPKTR